jgi:hypothetical protein
MKENSQKTKMRILHDDTISLVSLERFLSDHPLSTPQHLTPPLLHLLIPHSLWHLIGCGMWRGEWKVVMKQVPVENFLGFNLQHLHGLGLEVKIRSRIV